jgi:O-antigen/teichoic acid export membrane protein
MADRSGVLTGYLSVLSGDLGRILVFAAFVPLLVRTVDEAGFGTYAFVMAMFLPLRKVLNFGLFEATKTYATRESGRDRAAVVATSFGLHLAMLAVVLPAVYLLSRHLARTDVVRASFVFVLGALAGEQLSYFGRGVLHAHRRESLVEPLIPVRSLILAGVGLYLADRGMGVPGVFAGFATGFLLTGLASTGLALWKSDLTLPSAATLRRFAPILLTFGAPSMVLVLLTAGLYKTDIFLVQLLTDPTRTGFYRAAIQVAEFVWVVSLAMEMVMIQSTADLWTDGATERITDLLSRMLRYVVLFTVLLLAGVFVLGDTFLVLYFGPSFEASVLPLQVLLPGVLGFGVARVIWPVMQAGGYLRGIVTATGTAVALNVGLNLLLIPRIGIMGAAVSTSLSYGLMGLVHGGVARRAGVDPFRDLPVLRILALGAGTGAILWVLDPLSPWYLDLTLLPAVGLSVYLAGALRLGVVDRSELRDFVDRIAGNGGVGADADTETSANPDCAGGTDDDA